MKKTLKKDPCLRIGPRIKTLSFFFPSEYAEDGNKYRLARFFESRFTKFALQRKEDHCTHTKMRHSCHTVSEIFEGASTAHYRLFLVTNRTRATYSTSTHFLSPFFTPACDSSFSHFPHNGSLPCSKFDIYLYHTLYVHFVKHLGP